LSGRFSKAPYRTAAIEALQFLAPALAEITIRSIGDLPLFSPDREEQHIPNLAALVSLLRDADGLVIASSEYTHGTGGPMKNALDGLVSGVDFPDQPIMLMNTSLRASHAQYALKALLTTMSGNFIDVAGNFYQRLKPFFRETRMLTE